jgi:recombination endonuclease VII
MKKKKPKGICRVDVCTNPHYKIGLCLEHFDQLYHGKYRRPHSTGKASHPLLQIWRERHGYGSFPFEWMDFWKFVEDVGARPSEEHYLYKIDRFQPYSKSNFKWVRHIRRDPNETNKEWDARRWKQRSDLRPAIKEYGKNFRIYLKCGILKDPTHPLEEFSKLYLAKLEAQNSLCAICHKPETKFWRRNNVEKPKRLALDHCHKTMKLRDMLCERCNLTLGRVEESIDIIQAMIKYLNRYRINPSTQNYFKRIKLSLYDEMSEVCDICKQPETQTHQNGTPCRLCLDHCHATNKVRGWLCARCNTSLGRMEDSPELLQSMITYLKKHHPT